MGQIQLTPQQLQMIKLQMSGATQQPIIIQTAPIQAVTQQAQTVVTSQPQIIQLQQVKHLFSALITNEIDTSSFHSPTWYLLHLHMTC